jgi:hypothetical protein
VSSQDIREGMTVFDPAGRNIGHVEILRSGHFFLTHDSLIPVVRERIVVDADASVARVDASGVHLRHNRQELLSRNARPAGSKSSHEVAPGEDISSVHRGHEDRRPLDHDDLRAQRNDLEGRAGESPMQPS